MSRRTAECAVPDKWSGKNEIKNHCTARCSIVLSFRRCVKIFNDMRKWLKWRKICFQCFRIEYLLSAFLQQAPWTYRLRAGPHLNEQSASSWQSTSDGCWRGRKSHLQLSVRSHDCQRLWGSITSLSPLKRRPSHTELSLKQTDCWPAAVSIKRLFY